jgi:plasmid stabilization system protein ParE
MMPIKILPSARDDLKSIIRYYRKIDPLLAVQFVKEFEDCMAMVGMFPKASPLIYSHTRRVVMKNFPYLFLYKTDKTFVYIFAIFHQKENHRG